MRLGRYASARSASPIFSYAARHSGFRRVAGLTLLTGAPLIICRIFRSASLFPPYLSSTAAAPNNIGVPRALPAVE